jgi:hypothetical protein
MNRHYHTSNTGRLPTATRHHNSFNHNHSSVNHCAANTGIPLFDVCACAALLALACTNPRFASIFAITVVVVVVISCLATLAMSVTGETLLSIFLVGMVIAGVAALCKSQRGECCPQDNEGYGRNHQIR